MALVTLLVLPLILGTGFVYFFGHHVRNQEPAAGRIWVFALALLPVAVVSLATVGVVFTSAPSGDLAAWVEAVATAATLSAAVIAAHYAAKAYKVEQDRDEDRRKDVEKAQASLVAAWPTRRALDGGTGSRLVRSSDLVRGLDIRNGSPLPVTRAWCTVQVAGFQVADQAPQIELVGSMDVGLVPPSGERPTFRRFPPDLLHRIQELEEWFTVDELSETDVRVRLHFYDSANRAWQRDWDGELRVKASDDDYAPS